jgi:hypothetical protein
MNRRAFFRSAIAFVAALFTRKQTTLGTAPAGSSTAILVMVNPQTHEPTTFAFPDHLTPILSGPYKNAAIRS